MAADVIELQTARAGATPDDWSHFDLVLGLTADLLPVVSNPRATIAPDSTLKDLGKTPSRYNGSRHAVGFGKWTEHVTTPAEIATWSRDRDLGLCLQTRRVRALDVDVTDPALASQIHAFIVASVGALPARSRPNASKFLVAFEMPGDFHKRRVKCASGMVEFLAGGQQFICCGLHPSGVRYEWNSGLPDAFPVLSAPEFESLWAELTTTFGVEPASESQASIKGEKLASAIDADPVAQHLLNAGLVKRTERDGRLHITCPFEDEHTGESGDTSTTYWPAHTGGYINGHWKCLHAHCENREDQEFRDAIGFVDADLLAEFSAIGDPGQQPKASNDAGPSPIQDEAGSTPAYKPSRFRFVSVAEFLQGTPPTWLIKGVLPKATLGVLFGEPAAGKSFVALDMAVDLALGNSWRGLRTKKVRVAYIVAEGDADFRARLKALCQQRGIAPEDVPLRLLAEAPNFMEKGDVLALAKDIVAMGGADLIIIDTWAQVTPGANENSGEDMGRALAHCRGLHRATAAMVLLVHHSGKDASKGSRGWSGLRGAADVELEACRADERRSLAVTKLKGGRDGAEYAYGLETVVLGLDEDGDEITSCVVRHAEGGASVRKQVQAKLGQFERAVMDAVEEIMGLGTDAAPLEDVIQSAISRVPHEGGEDRRRDNVKRAVGNLVDKKGLLVRDGVGLRAKA